MKLIRITRQCATNWGRLMPGLQVSLPPKDADSLINAGLAEDVKPAKQDAPADKPAAEPANEPETAAADQADVEKAVKGKSTKGKK